MSPEDLSEAESRINEARRTGATRLSLSSCGLQTLPNSLRELTNLEGLDVYVNRLVELPKWLGEFQKLRTLNVSFNPILDSPDGFERLRDALAALRRLQMIHLMGNDLQNAQHRLGELFVALSETDSLQCLVLQSNQLSHIPEEVGLLKHLTLLDLCHNKLTDLPQSMTELTELTMLNLDDNALNPELAAAYAEGLDGVKRYLRAKSDAQIVLNEAKLILVGEGEVGKSCLLGALRGDKWEEGRPTTHGIEIKPFKIGDLTLNGWDFGGQPVYRPTHQLFFSAPAVYLVVWKPREGPQQNLVREWIRLVKHREPEAKILVVATHGGPGGRQPDIDRQEIWDLFGKETVVDFFHVDSKPPANGGDGKGIPELREAIAKIAGSLHEVGRSVPKKWQEARKALTDRSEAYLPLDRVFEICKKHEMDEEDTRLLLRICRRVGDLIYYENDPALHNIVVLKPDWLATAMSFVLDDEDTRKAHGLVTFKRFGQLWNDASRAAEFQYDERLHPLFLRLMERFDLSYKVSLPTDASDEISFWQKVGNWFTKGLKTESPEIRYTSLIAQLVPDVRPTEALGLVWPAEPGDGEEQQSQICRIVDLKSNTSQAEGLFYQLIVRLHRYSLGREDFRKSVHWQRGLVVDDEYNGRALLEHTGNDVRITVRAAYPEMFLSVLTREVRWLVENFWKGLRCDVMVPCIQPCGLHSPGTGMFEVAKLIESKRQKRDAYPCRAPACDMWQEIDHLLRNAPAARPDPVMKLVSEFHALREQIRQNQAQVIQIVQFGFDGLMTAITDEAKDGPRLFSFEPVERSAFNPVGWAKKRFRITLWCEHSRLPLPMLNGEDKTGVYEFDLTREWLVAAAPFLQALTITLTLVLPVAASGIKLKLDEAARKAIETQLEFGKSCAEAVLKTGEKAQDWIEKEEGPKLEEGLTRTREIRAEGPVLRQLQVWLKEKDPGFGGLVRVQNKRKEFLWVHPQFAAEY